MNTIPLSAVFGNEPDGTAGSSLSRIIYALNDLTTTSQAPTLPSSLTNKLYVDTAAAVLGVAPVVNVTDYIKKDGSVGMTANLTLTRDPVSDLEVSTKQYVLSKLSNATLASGTTIKKPTTVTPSGFLRLNGATLVQASYPALYAMFGTTYNLADSGQPWTQQSLFNTTQANVDLGSWANGSTIPVQSLYGQVAVTKNFVYLQIGSTNPAFVNTIYQAPISAGGVVGSWTLSTPTLTYAIGYSSLIYTKNRLYLLGGYDGTARNYVQTCAVNSDGSLGTWSAGTALPVAIYLCGVAVVKQKIYLIGGFTTVAVSTIYTANINSDGTIGTWSSYGGIPIALYYVNVAITSSRIYILGGNNSANAAVSSVYYAVINSDGTLGSWTLGTALPIVMYQHKVVVARNVAYIMDMTNVYRAPIDGNGVIGTWVACTGQLDSYYFQQAFVTSTRLYTVAGMSFNSFTYTNTIRYVTFTGGLNDYMALTGTVGTPAGSFVLPNSSSYDALTPGLYSYIKI